MTSHICSSAVVHFQNSLDGSALESSKSFRDGVIIRSLKIIVACLDFRKLGNHSAVNYYPEDSQWSLSFIQ